MNTFRRLFLVTAASVALTLVIGASAGAAGLGPPQGMIYAHDDTYRTVGTPATLPDHGFFDTIYVLGDGLAPVSEAAPGDFEYNGGRWEVRIIEFVNIPPTQFTNAEDILAAADNGDLVIGDVALRFECPLIKMR